MLAIPGVNTKTCLRTGSAFSASPAADACGWNINVQHTRPAARKSVHLIDVHLIDLHGRSVDGMTLTSPGWAFTHSADFLGQPCPATWTGGVPHYTDLEWEPVRG